MYKAEGLEAFYAHEEQQLHEEKKVNSASIIKMLENAPSHIEIFLYAIDAYSKVQLSQTIKEYIKPCLSRIKTLRAWGIYTKKIQDELLLLLARFYQEDLDEWLWEYKKALSEFEKYSDYLDKLKVLYKRNPEKWQEEYIKEVVIGSNDIDLLTDAYQICKNTQESKLNDMYIQIANELTTKYISINSFLKAEEILKESLSHLEPDKDDNLLIDTWIILIDCYKQQEFFSKAILYQEKILKIRESVYTKKIKLYKNSDFGHIGHILSYYIKDYLNALDELGFSYYMLKRFEEAIILEEKSYLILQDLYKKESEEWVEAYTISLSNLASSYSKQNRQSEAIVLREESLEILRELYKENSDRWIENYATSLDDLASSIGKQKDFKKASELFETYFDVSDFENQDDITYFMYPFIKWYQCEQRLGKSNAIERLDDLALKLIGLYKEKLAEEYKVVINQEYDTYLPLKDSEDEFTREKYEIFVKIFTK